MPPPWRSRTPRISPVAWRAILAEIERRLHDRLESSGRADADVLAGVLFVMLIGGMLLSVARGDAAVSRTVAVQVAEFLAGTSA